MNRKKESFLFAMIFALFFLNYGCAPAILYCRGNHFGSEEGILKQLRKEHPKIEKIMSIERNFYDYSIVKVRESGEVKLYCLNTSILLDHKFSECQKEK